MELGTVMRSTPGVRRFDSRDVPPELLHRALDAARFAPSGGNRQPWRVVAVRDREQRAALGHLYAETWDQLIAERPEPAQSLRALTEFAHAFAEVPTMITVWCDPAQIDTTDAAEPPPSVVAGGSVFPFVQNLVLALRDQGVAARVTTLLARAQPQVRALLGVPVELRLAAVLAVGYPKSWPTRLRRRDVAEFATWDSYAGAPVTDGAGTPSVNPPSTTSIAPVT